ncbi:MAG: MerR family transcriptional regulator [Deltaproteobacteria bacterium]|nr:MerR family transcriptional regulator [Deltaproteobacteria bacterium]
MNAPRSRALPKGLKIGELSRRTDTPKETIHFYLKEGILHAPRKTSRNMAYYDESHVARLVAIKRLRAESYLPLAAIKQLIERNALGESARRMSLAKEMLGARLELEPLSLEALATRASLPRSIVERAVDKGLIRARSTPEGLRFGDLDVRVADVLGASFGELEGAREDWWLERFEIIERHMRSEVEEEVAHFFGRVLAGGDPEPAIELLRGGRETIGRFLALSRARALTDSMEEIFAAVRAAVGETAPPVARLSDQARRELGIDEAIERAQQALASTRSFEAARELLRITIIAGEPSAALPYRSILGAYADKDSRCRWQLAEILLETQHHADALERASEPVTALEHAIAGAARLGRLQRAFAAEQAEIFDWAKSGEILRGLVRGLSELREAISRLDRSSKPFEELRALSLIARVEELCPPFLELRRRATGDFRSVLARATDVRGTGHDPGLGALERISLDAARALVRLGESDRPADSLRSP